MPTPDISVIMPSYNSAPWLGQAVESVLLQQGPTWELLIIDDASTDATPDLARRYATLDPRVRLLANAGQKGAGGARNTGLNVMRGRAVFFLDSDDILHPGALAALHSALERCNGSAVQGRHTTFCQQRWMTHSPEHRNRPDTLSVPLGTFWGHLFRADFLLNHAVNFPEDCPIGQDTVFLCHAYAHMDAPPALIKNPVLIYRVNHKPRSSNPASARAFLRRAFLAVDHFSEHGKSAWIAPFIRHYVLPGWLPRLYDARKKGEEEARAFINGCLDLFARADDASRPFLNAQAGPAAKEFAARRAGRDATGILRLLEGQGLLPKPFPFTGIARDPAEPGWRAYVLSRRLANMLRSTETRQTLRYLQTLRGRSARRLVLARSATAWGGRR